MIDVIVTHAGLAVMGLAPLAGLLLMSRPLRDKPYRDGRTGDLVPCGCRGCVR